MSSKLQLLESLNRELVLRKDVFSSHTVNTVYFGGGTPSVLKISETEELLNTIRKNYCVDAQAEITLECNPDDLDWEYLGQLQQTGVNRLSIGIQSFSDSDLKLMNRRHSSRQAVQAVKLSKAAGFSNLSIDLIYGLPEQDMEKWQRNIEQALELDVQHISAYHLTYHEDTVFYDRLKQGLLRELPDELSFNQFARLKETLEAAGFIHYEISNFAREGYYSRHNTAYWKQEMYLGIGPSAHSYNREILLC